MEAFDVTLEESRHRSQEPGRVSADRDHGEPGLGSDSGPLVRDRRALGGAGVLRLQRTVGNAGTAAHLRDDTLQREAEAGGGQTRSPVMDVVGKSGGSPLDSDVRSRMESALGADFSDVRLTVDSRSTEAVRASAYTVNNDIVVHPQHFQPGSVSAQRTLAHELTHVVQQRSGPVDGTPTAGGVKVSDPGDRFEREAEATAEKVVPSTAQRMAAGSALATGSAVGEGASPALSLQRSEEEEPVQRRAMGMVVQREEESESEGEE